MAVHKTADRTTQNYRLYYTKLQTYYTKPSTYHSYYTNTYTHNPIDKSCAHLLHTGCYIGCTLLNNLCHLLNI